jgi:chaperonin GroEL
MLEDIATLTGGKMIAEDLGIKLETLTLADLGRARRIEVDKESTVIIDAAGDPSAIQLRAQSIRDALERTTSEYDREKLEERLAKFARGVAVIRVGGASAGERREQIEIVETARRAINSALEEGIVPGAGHALLRAAVRMRSADAPEEAGTAVILRACQDPLRQLASNAGEDADEVITRVLQSDDDQGFDPAKGEYGDLVAAGVVDSAKSVRTALQNASPIAVQLLWSSVTP